MWHWRILKLRMKTTASKVEWDLSQPYFSDKCSRSTLAVAAGRGGGRHSTFAIKRPFLELINTAYSADKSMFSTCLHCLGHKRISINNSFNLLVNICAGSQLFQCQVLGSNSFSYQQKYMKNRRFLKYYFRPECRIYTHTHTTTHIYFR